jgi:hypothetical protein
VLGSGMSGVAFEQALEQCLSLAMGRLYCGPLKPWPSLHIGIIERIEKSEVLKHVLYVWHPKRGSKLRRSRSSRSFHVKLQQPIRIDVMTGCIHHATSLSTM